MLRLLLHDIVTAQMVLTVVIVREAEALLVFRRTSLRDRAGLATILPLAACRYVRRQEAPSGPIGKTLTGRGRSSGLRPVMREKLACKNTDLKELLARLSVH
jgi:hypothetical protein